MLGKLDKKPLVVAEMSRGAPPPPRRGRALARRTERQIATGRVEQWVSTSSRPGKSVYVFCLVLEQKMKLRGTPYMSLTYTSNDCLHHSRLSALVCLRPACMCARQRLVELSIREVGNALRRYEPPPGASLISPPNPPRPPRCLPLDGHIVPPPVSDGSASFYIRATMFSWNVFRLWTNRIRST